MNKLFLVNSFIFASSLLVIASEPPPPSITNFSFNGSQQIIKWAPFPAAKNYSIFSSTNLADGFTTNSSGLISGYVWTGTSTVPVNFYQLKVTPLTSNELLSANVLNRLAYGPSPD
ncbi:MAG: hypothetical protein ABIP71_11080, partial [Verrucomicrobiota bacterium]